MKTNIISKYECYDRFVKFCGEIYFYNCTGVDCRSCPFFRNERVRELSCLRSGCMFYPGTWNDVKVLVERAYKENGGK